MSQQSGSGTSSGVPEITATQLKARMDAGNSLLIVDVREAHERTIADLPDYGQRHIPVGEFEQRLDELDGSAAIVCYCRSGSRSAWAVSRLLDAGHEEALNLKGGILAWRQEVDPALTAY